MSLGSKYKDVVGPVYAGELAYGAGYVKPIRFKVTIKSADETEIFTSMILLLLELQTV